MYSSIFNNKPDQYKEHTVSCKEPHKLRVRRRHPVLCVETVPSHGPGFTYYVLENDVEQFVNSCASAKCYLQFHRSSYKIVLSL